MSPSARRPSPDAYSAASIPLQILIVNLHSNCRPRCVLAACFARGFCSLAASRTVVRSRWSTGSVRRDEGTFGGLDKRRGPRVALCGCLHIVFYGTTVVWRRPRAGTLRVKPLILLAGSGWQARIRVDSAGPDRSRPVKPARSLRSRALRLAALGALTGRPRPGCGHGSACAPSSAGLLSHEQDYSAASERLACSAVSIICMTKRCCAFGSRWMRSTCCRSLGAGPRFDGGDSWPIKSSTVTASVRAI